MKFVVSGNARIGGGIQGFAKSIEAKDEADAKEQTYSLFGSEHGTKRRWLTIDKVEKGKAKE